MKRAYQIIAPLVLVLISACSILPKPDPSDVYRLASAQTSTQGAPVSWSLRVSKPQSSEFLDSPRIAVVPNGDLISSYANSRWSDPTPVLLRNRFMDGFQRDGRVTLLSTDETNLQACLFRRKISGRTRKTVASRFWWPTVVARKCVRMAAVT